MNNNSSKNKKCELRHTNFEFYQKFDNKKLQKCLLCEKSCFLTKSNPGFCGVNIYDEMNNNCIVFNMPISVNIDPIEKKPIYNFLQNSFTLSIGTYGCNFFCFWCQNHEISQKRVFSTDEMTVFKPEVFPDLAKKYNCRSISYTYNEPTVFYPYAREIGLLAKKEGLKNIFVTNGYQTEYIIDDMSKWVDACNVDLKGFNKEKHLKYTGANRDYILRNINLLYKKGVYIELTTLIVPGFNDDLEEMHKLIDFILSVSENIYWHISRFFPRYRMQETPVTDIEFMNRVKDLAKSKGLKNVFLGNV
ncbi:MAG: radical SAM protein [Candidatus Delongbacteria bacterium]|nr:radical SAM protein [Candidatus Delongbacteria bacterium]MBN2836073.1 radical SAM protein [Candidatus Delongbacteria bacterium]